MLGDGAEMLVEPLLRGLVVIRRDAEDGVGAPQVELAQLVEDLGGGVAAATDDQRHAPGDMIGDEHGDDGPLGHVERGGLGRGAQCDDVIDAPVDDVIDHAGQRVVIDPALGGERRDHGDAHAGEFVLQHNIINLN